MWNGTGLGEGPLEPLEVVGWAAVLLMGTALGLFGAGGSILTVPILVFAFGQKPSFATHDALLIVASVSTLALCKEMRRQSIRDIIPFSLASVLSAIVAKIFLLPLIPGQIPVLGVSKENFMLALFGLLMGLGAWAMLRPNEVEELPMEHRSLYLLISAVAVGMVTGILGAGGGFLIVPALVSVAGIPYGTATKASLFVIAINTSTAFIAGGGPHESWSFLLPLIFLAFLGISLGLAIQRKISTNRLKKMFSVFVLIMALFVIWKSFSSRF